MKVDIVERPELRVAAVHHIGPYSRISQAFAKLGELAGKAGLFQQGATMIAVYHDDPRSTAEELLKSDAGLTVGENVKIPPGLSEVGVPGGRYAVITHVGPYETLGDAWHFMMNEWLPASGHSYGDGAAYEIYRNTPMDTPKENLITEIHVPIA